MAQADAAVARGLLRADEERLERAAKVLARGGQFVLAVIAPELWPAAVGRLRALLPAHTFIERDAPTSDEIERAIDDPLRAHAGATIAIRIGDAPGPIDVLNLQRDRLRHAAANFLVVLRDDDAHRAFQQGAPDAYSYRHLLIVLEGAPASAPVSDDDDSGWLDAATARASREADRELRAQHRMAVASKLQRASRLEEARALLDASIDELTGPGPALSAAERSTLAALYYQSAWGCDWPQMHRRVQAALTALAPVAEEFPEQYANIEGQLSDAIGTDLGAARRAADRARLYAGGDDPRPAMCLAQAYEAREQIGAARRALAKVNDEAAARSHHATGWALLVARLRVQEGAWSDADRVLRDGATRRGAQRIDEVSLTAARAGLLALRGEQAAALGLYRTLEGYAVTARLLALRSAAESGERGGVSLDLARWLDEPWPQTFEDGAALLQVHRALVGCVELDLANGHPGLSHDELDARLAALRAHLAQVEPAPPWSVIRAELLQADAWLRRAGAEDRALAIAAQAWQLAAHAAAVLAPAAAQRATVAALRLGQLDPAADWIARGLAVAEAEEHAGDVARLRGLAVWHAQLAGRAPDDAEAALAAALAASGSVLVEAEVRARIGAATGRRDWLRRAQEIYRGLPWPEREIACLAALGDARIAEVRCQTFALGGLIATVVHPAAPPPITATDD